MDEFKYVGRPFKRRDGPDKVHGRLRYTGDLQIPGMLYAVQVTSPHAHARIVEIDTQEAESAPGVRAVVTGEDFPQLLGLYLGDTTPLARRKVRHFGEAVAVVIADTEPEARAAANLVRVEYEPLPPLRSPQEALEPDAPVLHEELEHYEHIPPIRPEPGTNVANRTKIRKGDVEAGFAAADAVVELEVSFPPADHVALEPRVAIAEVGEDGTVVIHSATQAPFVVRQLMSIFFSIPAGKIVVHAAPLGGGFGGKAGIQLEGLAYLLSRHVGGRPVRLLNSREEDLVRSPGHIGLHAKIKLGATEEGTLTALEALYLFDSGGYADYAVNISRAAAIACTGPYNIPNVHADSLCVYTNHPFATAFRGFGHEINFVIDRAMDELAEQLDLDPVEFRIRNAIRPGDLSPTRSIMDANTGDLAECVRQAARMIDWDAGARIEVGGNRVRAKGLGCFWKAPAMPTNAGAGAVLTFNDDGSVNLSTGIVEIGQGSYAGLAQIVAEALDISPDRVHVSFDVETRRSPHDWATAASRSLFMAGRAALAAVEDAKQQIKEIAAAPLQCPVEDLEVAEGWVRVRDEPVHGLPLSKVVLGHMYPDGTATGGQVIGRGNYIARWLTDIDPETGEGRPALEWTMGTEAVEVEVDLTDGSYEVLRAVCAMDVGQVINPDLARGQMVGAMAMALGGASTEAFIFDSRERVLNAKLRDFKILRIEDAPEYEVAFVETPQRDGPYNARGLGEQGVLGMYGALSNALSRAIGKPLNHLPLTPERVWEALQSEEEDA